MNYDIYAADPYTIQDRRLEYPADTSTRIENDAITNWFVSLGVDISTTDAVLFLVGDIFDPEMEVPGSTRKIAGFAETGGVVCLCQNV